MRPQGGWLSEVSLPPSDYRAEAVSIMHAMAARGCSKEPGGAVRNLPGFGAWQGISELAGNKLPISLGKASATALLLHQVAYIRWLQRRSVTLTTCVTQAVHSRHYRTAAPWQPCHAMIACAVPKAKYVRSHTKLTDVLASY